MFDCWPGVSVLAAFYLYMPAVFCFSLPVVVHVVHQLTERSGFMGRVFKIVWSVGPCLTSGQISSDGGWLLCGGGSSAVG